MHALVTGGACFIGSHSVDALPAAGARVLDKLSIGRLDNLQRHERLELIGGDIRDLQAVARVYAQGIITGWRIRGTRFERNLRVPATLGIPDLDASRAVAGYNRNSDDYYVYLASDDNELAFAGSAGVQPCLVSANAHLESASRSKDTDTWTLPGYVPLQVTLANVDGCRVRADGRALTPVRRQSELSPTQLPGHAARPLEAIRRR